MRADPERVRTMLGQLAEIGVDPAGGWSRLAYGEEERRAHRLFARWMEELGARVRTDAVGNTLALVPGREDRPVLATGSHLDSVYSGGNYDGAVGVVAAVETARQLVDGDGLRGPLLVVAFAAEEGARFGAPCLGSRVVTGAFDADTLRGLRDEDGVSAYDSAQAVGLQPDRAASARWPPGRLGCFVEVHIEQGRVLQEAGGPLGVVTAIGGSNRSRLTFLGTADHSGATPMRLRRDALAAAAALVLEVERRARLQSSAVATVGRLRVRPNSMTTVPGVVELALDVRDTDLQVQSDLTRTLLGAAEEIATSRGVGLEVVQLSEQAPVVLDTGVGRRLGDAARELGLPCLTLPSGASHDTAHLSATCPTGMVFVPCRDGVSHAPEEFAESTDVARAADVVARTFRDLDLA